MDSEFKEKTVIIAGSEGLLGKVIEEQFSQLNANVIGLDIKNGDDLTDEAYVKKYHEPSFGCKCVGDTVCLKSAAR